MDVAVRWVDGMAFEAEQDGVRFLMEGSQSDTRRGPGPKGLLLSGLAGCSGIDVVEILKKMRVDLKGLEMRVHADLSDAHPRVFTRIHLEYCFRGQDLPLEKLQRAVDLSLGTYCGVAAMLEKGCPISHSLRVV